MLIFLARHPESSKNVVPRFASPTADEELTDRGVEELHTLVGNLLLIRTALGNPRTQLYSADSVRALSLAEAIGIPLQIPTMQMADLRSIVAGDIAGVPESVVMQTHRSYFRDLTLYRAGVLSSYDLAHPGESLRGFEARIAASLRIIESGGAELAIVSAHKSSVTASLIHYARRFHGYPQAFFGFVDLPTGSLSLVDVQGTTDGRILFAGARSEAIAEWAREEANRQ